MSTGIEGKVSGGGNVSGDGGTRCFGADVTTAVTSALLAFMLVPADGACLDGQSYPYKAIVFHDGLAIAVRCITANDAARLRTARDLGTADVMEPSPEDVAAVATIITCPPLAPGGGTTAYELEVQNRLDQLTVWAQLLFDTAPARAPAEPSAA